MHVHVQGVHFRRPYGGDGQDGLGGMPAGIPTFPRRPRLLFEKCKYRALWVCNTAMLSKKLLVQNIPGATQWTRIAEMFKNK